MISRLLWKEFRENIWKAAILMAVSLLCIALGNVTEAGSGSGLREARFEWGMACLFIISVIAPIWLASGFTAAERRSGSFDVLLALPVRRTLLFLIKALTGLVTYFGPILLAWF